MKIASEKIESFLNATHRKYVRTYYSLVTLILMTTTLHSLSPLNNQFLKRAKSTFMYHKLWEKLQSHEADIFYS